MGEILLNKCAPGKREEDTCHCGALLVETPVKESNLRKRWKKALTNLPVCGIIFSL